MGCFTHQSLADDGVLPNVIILDPVFEQFLIISGIDTDATINGQISNVDAEAVTNLDVSNRGITDLTGIEGFINLTFLNCSTNNLQNLNLSQNTALTEVNCQNTNLNNIVLPASTTLEIIELSDNNLTSADFSANSNLTSLSIARNNLASLDLSQNTALETLNASDNELIDLDLSLNFPSQTKATFPETTPNQSFVEVPIGLGIRYTLSEFAIISADVTKTAAFSDVVDGISRNGNSQTNDWYAVGRISVAILLTAEADRRF